jgi:hypothetical protein
MEVIQNGDEFMLEISCNFAISLVGVILNNKKLCDH